MLNIRYMRMAMEANDKGRPLTQKEIFSRLADQLGIGATDVQNALEKFWDEPPKAIARCPF